jgi:hypothetical protein
MRRRVVLSSLVAAVVLVGLMAQPGGAVNVPQPVVVSADPANWTPHVLDGKVDAIVAVGDKIVAGGLFTQVPPPPTRRPRSPAATSSPSTPPPGRSTPTSRR